MKNMFFTNIEKIINYRLGVFLSLCLAFGGTSQDIIAPKLPVYMVSLVLIGWSLMFLNKDSRLWEMKLPLFFLSILASYSLVFLIPLPPEMFREISEGVIVQEGFRLINLEMPNLPISLNPERTLFSLFDFLPPIAVLMMIGTIVTKKEMQISIWIVLCFSIMSVFFGLLQISKISNNLYLYSFTDMNAAVGLFSNPNHQASFLVNRPGFTGGCLV